MPLPMVALPWGSRSTSRVRLPSWERAAAKFTEVVVLPTPPFWFAMVRMSVTGVSVGWVVRMGAGKWMRGYRLQANRWLSVTWSASAGLPW